MKKLAMSVVGMAFAAIATNALAITEELGVIPMDGDFEVVSFGNFVENESEDGTGTTFTDRFNFTIADEITATDISVIRLPLTQRGMEILLFDEFRTTLINGVDTVLFDSDGQSGDLSLAPGDYTIQVSGRAIGVAGGLYQGAIVVSTIPIPAAGLLFFSGMAALGLVRSRRARA